LIQELVTRTHASLAGDEVEPISPLSERFPWNVSADETLIEISTHAGAATIYVATPDRLGLVEAVAGALSLQRLDVRTANLDTVGGVAYQEWSVAPQFGDAPSAELIRAEIEAALADVTQVAERIGRLTAVRPSRRGFIPPPPRIRSLPHASHRSTVVEVRAHDAPALLFRVTEALAELDVSITSARVLTLGSEVVDVLYLQDVTGQPLSVTDTEKATAAISAALIGE
jgi:[protein-PII] uridylyltransferase